ncbi:PREDICTED: sulfotransferase family cytosolic 1B member 1-like [Nicrophorus vespilloides]|uniref:Sulfotransferase family cytosolic 1B member 1-like n=1 Tax=Nicrophorus vespilloides TaxID=110193 RepID=A0ABM1N5L2_NICVS|nr:PREDICTED: sulfotransferase family cytosolic 1B member 1-like [Nicrophorus vespilloides]
MEIKSAEELDELRNQHCLSSARKGYGVFKGYALPENFAKYQKEIEDLEVYDDDVWVTSFPKCGTTWTQEMVWCIANDLDFEAAKVDLDERFPFVEYCVLFGIDCPNDSLPNVRKSIEYLKSKPRPRFVKTHLPWELLPKQIRNFERRPKIIHVARNPKDVCVSYYHHLRLLENYSGDLDLHMQLFVKNKLGWTPFFDNILGYWKRRSESNIIFLKYEDMKKDLRSVVVEVSDFLGVKLDEDQMKRLLHHLSFEQMKNNSSTDHSALVSFLKSKGLCYNPGGVFMRSGDTGSFKSEMSPKMIEFIDRWTEENLAGTGLKF